MVGRYQIVEIVGSGASAQVCLARRRSDGPDAPLVALKVLRAELLSKGDASRRFRDENRILTLLDHPTVVRGYGLFDYDGRLVLELEFVRGPSVEEQLGELGPLPQAVTLAVVRAVASALDAAYQTPGPAGLPLHIVHRDLKPGNIAIDLTGRVRLLDFGVAKGAFDARAAQSLHGVWGTLGYDAPERKSGINDLPSGDVYALGVTLFVMLTQYPMMLSMKVERHDDDVQSLLKNLPRLGIDDPRFGELIKGMLSFRYQDRPDYNAVVATIDGIQTEAEGVEAVRSYAQSDLCDLYDGRKRIEPSQHGAWRLLRFLEEVNPTPLLGRLTQAEASVCLAQLMSLPDWEHRSSEFEPILEAADKLDLTRFVRVVERAWVPGWKFWLTQSRPGEVETALLVLNRFERPLAQKLATSLTKHPIERVAKVAVFILS